MKIIAGVLLLIPLCCTAQITGDMLQQLEKMQICMEKIDQTEVKALQQKSQALQAKIETLCHSGKSSQAQQQAMDFGREVSKSKTVKQVAKCAKMMEGIIPEIPLSDFDKDYSKINICDGLVKK